MKYYIFNLIIVIFTGLSPTLFAQGYLHTEGKNILDSNNENFIIRSIGTGNWMLMEGYMMQSDGTANTQHEFRQKLEDIIGLSRTNIFYDYWLKNHFTKRDVDSLAAWGFNAIRPALHYKWFTLPIEDEPVKGKQTWLDKGFALTDSLVKWCSANRIYVIFDMHGAPGGQGKNADISDYDPAKPSLWESEENKTKLVALWYEIAKRYSREPGVGGYDLINETNWAFKEGNNSQLRDIYKRITDTIRLVDNNHILYIEGNSFANDHSGLTPPWDDNMVYSFHKYWSFNDENSLDWIIQLRNQANVPLWLGESGENSNTWYRNLISLTESKNIGWSWWPVKKVAVNNPLQVIKNEDYTKLIEYWKGNASKPSSEAAFNAVMKFAENHNIANCIVQRDVLDAMFRQPNTDETIPYISLAIPGDIQFAVNYDLGRNNYAYFDTDTADYSLGTGEYSAWNTGYLYRNDGVDIEACTDTDTTNGYNVGWIKDGEWLVYSMYSDSAVLADCIIRYASGGESASVVLEAEGNVISEVISLGSTGTWQNWKSALISDVILPAGTFKLKVKFVRGGINFNYMKFTNIRSAKELKFKALYCETAELENEIYLHLNKKFETNLLLDQHFTLDVGDKEVSLKSVNRDKESPYILHLEPDIILPHSTEIKISYKGKIIRSGEEILESFSDMNVMNKLIKFPTIPARIQAEDFLENKGFLLEDCEDTGDGKNTAYANAGDYLDYIIHVAEAGEYTLTMRVALNAGNAVLKFQYKNEDKFMDLKSMALGKTGGWQKWQNQETILSLPEGKYIFRIKSLSGEHNINWFELSPYVSIEESVIQQSALIYPNPARDWLFVKLPLSKSGLNEQEARIQVFDCRSSIIIDEIVPIRNIKIYTDTMNNGVYFLKVVTKSTIYTSQFIVSSNSLR